MAGRTTRPIRPGMPGGPDGPPRRKPRKQASDIAPIALVLAVVLGVWLLNGRDPGTGTGSAPDLGSTTSYVDTTGPTASGATGTTGIAGAPSAVDPVSGLPYVAVADLPPEARGVLDLIDAGGPFAYDEDGSAFGNYEGLLPDEARGYYAEYTVDTPGSDDRGARRIIAGDAGERYWTDDHYASFAAVEP